MTPHPLLTKVLADAADYDDIGLGGLHPRHLAESMVAGFPPDIADRLERALDVCRMCGTGGESLHRFESHPYQPLVTP